MTSKVMTETYASRSCNYVIILGLTRGSKWEHSNWEDSGMFGGEVPVPLVTSQRVDYVF